MEKPSIVLCDIDGTVALRGDRSAHDHWFSIEDAPNENIIELVVTLNKVYEVIFVSGRQQKFRPVTVYWMSHHLQNIAEQPLFMRRDGDERFDDIVKQEIYKEWIEPVYHVKWVLDDRDRVVKMWRELGLTCLQVAEGNF